MATSAVSSHGTFLKVGDGAEPEVFTTIAEVKDLDGPEMTLNTEDVTSHDSGGAKEFIATLLESGDVSFDINYTDSATHELLQSAQIARETLNFQMVFPLATPIIKAFSAIVTSFKFSAPVEGILTASVTLKISGIPTVVA